VSNKENQAQIYACLWLQISETDIEIFLKNKHNFLTYWNDEEEQFTRKSTKIELVRKTTKYSN